MCNTKIYNIHNFHVLGDTDFYYKYIYINFKPGEDVHTLKHINISIINDISVEGDESFLGLLRLLSHDSSKIHIQPKYTTVKIMDDDRKYHFIFFYPQCVCCDLCYVKCAIINSFN